MLTSYAHTRGMRILYILPRPFGLLGNNASYMVPSIAKGLCDVRVVAFEANEIERKQIVYKDPALDCIHYPRVPVMLRMSYVLRTWANETRISQRSSRATLLSRAIARSSWRMPSRAPVS